MNYKFTDVVADGEEYKDQFDTMRKVLMIAQHKDIHDSKKLEEEVGVDVEKVCRRIHGFSLQCFKNMEI